MRKMFLVCAALFSLAACRREDAGTRIPDTGMANLFVTVGCPATKASGAFETGETSLASVQVFCFDMALGGSLEKYVMSDSSSAEMAVISGTKHIYALANGPDMSSAGSESAFLSSVSSFADNSLSSFQMLSASGADAEYDVSGECSISLPVRRLVSKVLVDTVQADFVSVGLRPLDFVINSIYLANAAKDVDYAFQAAPSGFFTGSEDNGDAVNGMIREAGLGYNLKDGGMSVVRHGFYVYPNATDDRTSVVIEAVLAGVPQTYVFELPEVGSNKVYDIQKIRITRPAGELNNIEFTVSVAEWETGAVISEFTY